MIALLLATVILSPRQDPAWQPQGGIQSHDFKVEHRSEDGRVVEGTEFVHLEYKVSLKQVPSDDVEESDAPPLRCVRECRGTPHKNHSECTPNSCDDACTKKHEKSLRGRYKPLLDNMRQARADSGKLARAAGVPPGPDNWSDASSSALRAIKQNAESLHKVSMGHTNEACGVRDGYFGLRRTDIYVKGEFRKVGFYMSKGVKTPIDEPAGSHEMLIAQTWIPEKEPIRNVDGWICHCFKRAEPPKQPPGTTANDNSIGRTPTYSGLGWRKPDGTVVIPDEKQVKIQTSGDGINNINFHVENNSGQDLQLETIPGTICTPNSPKIQIMVIVVRVVIMVPAGATIEASVNPLGGTAGDFKSRVVCTEINKLPPDEKTTFKLATGKDDALASLCERTAASRLRGPWDQARVWIYMDGASIDEINEHLVPGVSPGRYVTVLHEVETLGGVDLSAAKFRKCFDPKLLAGDNASPEATAWYVQRLAEMNKKGLLDSVRNLTAEWKRVLGGTAEDVQVEHVAAVASGMLQSPAEEVRVAGLKLLAELPAANRAALVKFGALYALGDSISSKSAAEVDAALDVLSVYRPDGAKAYAAYAAEFGPSEAVQKKASSIVF
jgi:hypothetical protein